MNETYLELNVLPDPNYLWKGLGGNFDSLVQIINEFIDNSISSFRANEQIEIKKVFVRIDELPNAQYKIAIEDSASGIPDLQAAFTIGNRVSQMSSLNEHGFGMKHALAAANCTNSKWKIITRTAENRNSKEHVEIKAPYNYRLKTRIVNEKNEPWIGKLPTGTIVEFTVEKHWMETISRGLQGNYSRLQAYAEILQEELGYTYSYFIKNSLVGIAIQYKSIDSSSYEILDVPAVEPTYDDTIDPGIGSVMHDLGNGEVEIEYEFLKATKNERYKKYYKANMQTSGVEIRVNGRLLEDNLFTEIWKKERHNSYNYILIRINIVSDDYNRLPATTTNKDGLRQDDSKLEQLYMWIRSKLSDPQPRASLSDHETDLFDQLRNKKMLVLGQLDSSFVVEREKHAFVSIGEKVRIDLYQSLLGKTTIYEGKKDKTTPQDVYQLLMYWDGLLMDGVRVDEAVLIAAEHPDSVKALISIKNEAIASDGRNYFIKAKEWKEEDIAYPN